VIVGVGNSCQIAVRGVKETDHLHGRSKLESETLARRVADLALDRKALDLIVIDVRNLSTYTDFIVVASGTSDRHVQSVVEQVAAELRDEGVRAIGSEGLSEGQWALLDFGSVVLHVFHQFTRGIYDLEGLWKSAPRIVINASATASGA